MNDQWQGRDVDPAKCKTYARFCREHDFRLKDDTLTCPFPPPTGHQVGSSGGDDADDAGDAFIVREVAPPMSPEKLRAFREAFIWAAGVFDARGNTHVTAYSATKNGRRYRKVVVRIRIGERKALDEIVATTGIGSVFLTSSGETSFGGDRERYEYRVEGWTAVRFLMAIWPSLRSKRQAVQDILSGPLSGPVE